MRTALLAALAVIAGCGSRKEPPPAQSSGSGSAAPSGSGVAPGSDVVAVKVVPLVWTTPGGEKLLALTENGAIEGPCGPVGKLVGGDVEIEGTSKMAWTGVERTGTKYKVAPLQWTIEVAPGGEVTVTQPDRPAVPLGKVTGTGTEDGAKLFAALVLAAPVLQIKLAFQPASNDPVYELSGSADLEDWRISQGASTVKRKSRDQPPPERKHPVTEAPDGTVTETATGKVLGKLIGRRACAPHDKAVTALIETYLAR